MLNKILISACVSALMAGSASALVVTNESVGNSNANAPVPLADSLAFAVTPFVISSAGQTRVNFSPSAGLFPTGNVLVGVDVTGATFNAALTGAELTGASTSVISSGGLSGGSTVTFIISGASACTGPTTCAINLPLRLTGADVTFAVGLQTDAGAPVDNSSLTNKVTTTVIDTVPAFNITVVPSVTLTNATLASTPPFSAVSVDSTLGTVDVTANAVTYAALPPEPVNRDLAGTNVTGVDVLSVNLVVSGFMDAFDPVAAPAGGNFRFAGTSFTTINSVTDTATANILATTTIGGAAGASIDFIADGTTPVQRSAYPAAVTVTPAVASPIKAGTSLTAALQTVTRDGTQVTFPWTQTSTQGAVTGATSVYRIGNLNTTAAGAVFVEAKNSTTAGYTNPGIVQFAPSIAAKGELVADSSSIEAALGNYGRGDLEFTVEAQATSLTARQFVVRNGVIQQVIGGTVSQDQN